MNNRVKALEKVSFGIAIVFGIYWIYACFIMQYLPIAGGFKTIIGLVVLYVFGLGLFLILLLKRLYSESCSQINY